MNAFSLGRYNNVRIICNKFIGSPLIAFSQTMQSLDFVLEEILFLIQRDKKYFEHAFSLNIHSQNQRFS